MISSGIDVVTFLKEWRQQIRVGFGEVINSRGELRQSPFCALRRLLADSETAEEEVIRPAARSELTGGQSIVERHLLQKRREEMAFAEREELDGDSIKFESKLVFLQRAVLVHAEIEEINEFEHRGERSN